MRLLLVFFVLLTHAAQSQIDTLFWFAAPEVVNTHSDRPIRFIVSSFSEKSVVKVDMPSNPAFIPIEVSMEANSSSIIDLTDQIDLIENRSYNTINSSGLRIQSTNLISAYYEVLGTKFLPWTGENGVTNTDIFTLKGTNALGNEFYLPFQNRFNNAEGALKDSAWAAVEILATEDNTTIEVYPTEKFLGHSSDFTITLNKGEVYTLRADTILGELKPMATRIVSDKPISITTNDDSILHPDGGWDLIGDQLIPVSKLGFDYIIRTGFAYVIATKNNTQIMLDGVIDTTLNEGQFYEIEVIEKARYLNSTEPISVLQLVALGGELGAAILPQVNCTGSSSIRFSRSTDESFYLDLITKKGSENDFVLNGKSEIITAAHFEVVPGTNGKWLFASIDFSNQDIIKTNELTQVSNQKSPFHLGILNGQASVTGARYGYFSNFGSFDLGPDTEVCGSETVELSGGLGRDSYQWSTISEPNLSQSEILEVTQSGVYKLNATEGVNCIIKDSIKVTFHDLPQITLDYTNQFCQGDSVEIKVTSKFAKYEWDTLNTGDSSITVKKGGEYQVIVTDSNLCEVDNTAFIEMIEVPTVNLGSDIDVCGTSPVTLEVDSAIDSVLWSTESILSSIEVSQSGKYKVIAINADICKFEDSIEVRFHTLPQVSLEFLDNFCEGDSIKIKATNGFSKYQWNTSLDSDSSLVIKKGGTYFVTVTDSNLCEATSTNATISMTPLPNVNLGPETQMLCAGASKTFSLDPQFSYLWENGSSSSKRVISEEGLYSLEVFNECGSENNEVVFNTWNINYPNVLTPNGDGKNEAFVVSGISFGTWSLSINNRYGKIVYQSDDYQNNYIPENLSDGIYYFILSQGDECNTFKGWIQVIR